MDIPSSPRIPECLRIARKFIKDEGICWLPINPHEIATRNGWELVKVGKLAKDSGSTRSEVLKYIKSNDGSAFSCDGDCKIVYNELIWSDDRIRWTIMHEIGHIVLGHFRDFNKTQISRGGLTSDEYDVLEREAETFTAEVLSPMAILKKVGAFSQAEIIKVAKLSNKAAEYRERDIAWHGFKKIYCEADTFLCSHFSLYLSFVSVCKSDKKLFIKSIITQNIGRSNMANKVLYATTDENNKYAVCPRCGNLEFSHTANFCKMCGLYLYNICGDIPDHYHEAPDGTHTTTINPGDARYCEHCGEETLLTRLGLLMAWEEVLAARKEIAAGLQPTIITKLEDDIPF